MAHNWTWEKLANNAYRLNPKSRGHNYPYVPRFETLDFTSGQNRGQNVIVPYVVTHSLLISLRAWGVTQSALHAVTLFFNDVDIQTENPNDPNYFQLQYNGQMYWIHKLDRRRNPLTSRCSCFTGDTKVLLADGTTKTFKELEGQTNFKIISYNEKTDKFEAVTAYNCEKKQENTEIIRVHLDNGTYLDCTPDHRFLTRGGEWLRADNLIAGTSLRALYMDKMKMERILPNNKREKIKNHKPEQKFYVYIYLDPRYPGEYKYSFGSFDFKPIYVGKGCGNRYKSHLNTTYTDCFHNTVRKLCEMGIPPIIMKLKVGLQEDVAFQTEKQWTEEIGLEKEGKGPLLNCRIGGEGGISTHSALKTKIKNIENGTFEKHRQKMLQDNPMKKEDIKQRKCETYLHNYTHEERSKLAKNASDSMPKEQRIEMGKQCFEKGYKKKLEEGTAYQLTEQYREECRERINSRIHASEKALSEWKSIVSQISKNNWNNPEIREKMLNKQNYKKQQKQKLYTENTKSIILNQIKQFGWFDKTLYKPQENCYTSMINGHYDLIRECYQEIYGKDCNIKKIENFYKKQINPNYINHKVTKIEKISNADVYCLTAEYLGNFVVDCSDKDSKNIFSGVTVANCKDYIFTWAWYNYYNGHCLYGTPPKPYKKLTNRPSRNPNHMPGICKHIFHAWEYLRNSGMTMN